MSVLVRVPLPKEAFLKEAPPAAPVVSAPRVRHAEAPDRGIIVRDGPDHPHSSQSEAPDAGLARNDHLDGWSEAR